MILYRRKLLISILLLFSFNLLNKLSAENTLQSAFFDSTKYAVKGFCENPENKNLALPCENQIKRFYSRFLCSFEGENHTFVSVVLAEKLFPEKTGEIECLFSYDDLTPFDSLWIENAVQKATEPEPVSVTSGESLLEILEKGDSHGIAEPTEDSESEKSEESDGNETQKAEFSYRDKNGSLRRFYYDAEGYSVYELNGNFYSVNTYEKQLVRKCFDSQFRLVKVEKLDFSSDSINVKPLNSKIYEYSDDSLIPSELIENRYDSDLKIQSRFNEKGLPESVETGTFAAVEDKNTKKDSKTSEKKAETPENNGKAEKQVEVKKEYQKDKVENYKYDDKNRIAEYEVTEWQYDKTTYGKKISKKINLKYVYTYHDELKSDEEENVLPPDFELYEDEKLKMTKKYKSETEWTETMMFEDDFSVEAFYKDSVKKEEIIYLNGKETRRRSFE